MALTPNRVGPQSPSGEPRLGRLERAIARQTIIAGGDVVPGESSDFGQTLVLSDDLKSRIGVGAQKAPDIEKDDETTRWATVLMDSDAQTTSIQFDFCLQLPSFLAHVTDRFVFPWIETGGILYFRFHPEYDHLEAGETTPEWVLWRDPSTSLDRYNLLNVTDDQTRRGFDTNPAASLAFAELVIEPDGNSHLYLRDGWGRRNEADIGDSMILAARDVPDVFYSRRYTCLFSRQFNENCNTRTSFFLSSLPRLLLVPASTANGDIYLYGSHGQIPGALSLGVPPGGLPLWFYENVGSISTDSNSRLSAFTMYNKLYNWQRDARYPRSGYNGYFYDRDGKLVTVVNGLIKSVTVP